MNAMAFQNLLVFTFKFFSKPNDCINPLSIKEIFKNYLRSFKKLKALKKWKNIFFCVLKKGTPSVTFLKLFPLPLIWNNKINFFVNTIEVSNFTQLG